jgi:tRNA U54 and U55 pseudouridine synthase Pus10
MFQNITIGFNAGTAAPSESIFSDITQSLRTLRNYNTVAIRGLQSTKDYRKLRRTITRTIWHQSQISTLIAGLKQQGNEAFKAQD